MAPSAPGFPHDLSRPLLIADEDDEEAIKAPDTASVGRLLSEARPEALTLTIASFFLLLGSLANLAVPKVAGGLVDVCSKAAAGELTPGAASQQLNLLLYAALAILGLGGLASGIRNYLFSSAAERVMCRLRVRVFSRLVVQEVAFFDSAPVGELSNRLSEDTRAMKDAATTSISSALRSAVTTVLGATLMFITSWRLALLTCVTLPITLISFLVFARFHKRFVAGQLAASAAATAVAQESLAGIRTIRSFAKEQQTVQRYTAVAHDILSWGLRSATASGIFTGCVLPIATGLLMVVLWDGSRQVLAGELSLGDLNAFILYAIFVAGSAGGLAGTAVQVVGALGAGRRVFQLMDRTPQLPSAGSSKPVGSPEGAALQLQGVWFAYPKRPSVPVLSGFNLTVEPGQKVALVGPSGGGKSTVVKLVQRFYDPQQGAVLLDGVPVRDIKHEYLHQQVALVAQEPVVFAESIMYNIMFGLHLQGADAAAVDAAAAGAVRGAATSSSSSSMAVPPSIRERVVAAAQAAHAHDFIMALPKGYDSLVGQQGVMLSGGQKQRLAIARALLTQPRLLLLDEATSALDAESEALVQTALEEAAHLKSVLVIAHRLSTVTGADLVAVVAGGMVVEAGKHDSLVATGGAYSQLVRRQVFTVEGQGSESQGRSSEADGVAEDGVVTNGGQPS